MIVVTITFIGENRETSQKTYRFADKEKAAKFVAEVILIGVAKIEVKNVA